MIKAARYDFGQLSIEADLDQLELTLTVRMGDGNEYSETFASSTLEMLASVIRIKKDSSSFCTKSSDGELRVFTFVRAYYANRDVTIVGMPQGTFFVMTDYETVMKSFHSLCLMLTMNVAV